MTERYAASTNLVHRPGVPQITMLAMYYSTPHELCWYLDLELMGE